jgi:hypothetical protein
MQTETCQKADEELESRLSHAEPSLWNFQFLEDNLSAKTLNGIGANIELYLYWIEALMLRFTPAKILSIGFNAGNNAGRGFWKWVVPTHNLFPFQKQI